MDTRAVKVLAAGPAIVRAARGSRPEHRRVKLGRARRGRRDSFAAKILQGGRLGNSAPTCSRIALALLPLDDPNLCWKAIYWTQGRDEGLVGFVGGNAATLLRLLGESFVGKNLERTVLIGADLTNVDLTKVNLRSSLLRETNLVNSTIRISKH